MKVDDAHRNEPGRGDLQAWLVLLKQGGEIYKLKVRVVDTCCAMSQQSNTKTSSLLPMSQS